MLRFFRQIRKKLMEQSKVRKYLFYAIGEIALVMIGILLALQVNNWNENRLQENEEAFYLQKLQQSITQDTTTYSQVIELLDSAIDNLSIIQNELNDINKEAFSVDITSPLLSTYKRSIERSTWDNLISTGKISLIQNNAVSDSLFKYYYAYENNILGWNEAQTHYTRQMIAPFLMEFDDTNWDAFNITAANLGDDVPLLMKKSISEYRDEALFRNILRFKISTLESVKQVYIEILLKAKSLMSLIDQELTKAG